MSWKKTFFEQNFLSWTKTDSAFYITRLDFRCAVESYYKLVYKSEKSFENEYHDVVKPFLDEIKP